MRVPFIAAWAGPDPGSHPQRRLPIAGGAVQRQLAAVYDIFPTVVALAGLEPPPGHVVDGQRLDRLFSGAADPDRGEQFLMHYPHEHRSDYFTVWRDGDWKLIHHYFPAAVSGGSRYQLYDLRADPFEEGDLAATEPATLRRLMQGLVAACESQGALYPVDPATGSPQPPR